MGFAAHSLTAAEQKALIEAERRGEPFLAYRDGLGDLRFTELASTDRVSIGRTSGNDVVLDWDGRVSRSHAQLELVGSDWTVVDDGLSRNGSHVNGERIFGRRRLSDGDVVRVGQTSIVFCAPTTVADNTLDAQSLPPVRLTEAERRVLVALCAPLLVESDAAAQTPATNGEIADALQLSRDGVKTHVRSLFTKLGVGDLPQYQKRTELARRALDRGLVTKGDLISEARPD
jgi:pSer/pThr/pTyr-binding forkhead associated (FHA) protein